MKMSINLQKGQKIDLTKGNAGLKHLMVGLGWDEVTTGNSQDIDCDAVAILLQGGKLKSDSDTVYFANLQHSSGGVKHMGDNLTGAGEGDDEQVFVDLTGLPAEYDRIVFAVNIYQAQLRGQHFGMIKNAFIRLVDKDSGKELCIFNLSQDYDKMTAVIFGEVYRHNNEWKFASIGEGTGDDSTISLASRYR
jgi:stress response protein SCP2